MSSGSSDVVGLEVDALHGTGTRISGRAAGGGSAARGLLTGLDSAHPRMGHPLVRSALSTFVTTEVMDLAHHLATNVSAAGHHVSNVAATGRDSDNDGARGLSPDLAAAEASYADIDGRARISLNRSGS